MKVFLLDLNTKARMIDHAFLGRFRDENVCMIVEENNTTVLVQPEVKL